jgi:ribosomal protein S6--L-glutamate ligase
MILSFHPCFVADRNLLCAGRKAGSSDLEEIGSADAVILPQGCREDLYRMARENCTNVFPDYEARFKYPGKTGQIRLFQKTGASYPETKIYINICKVYDLSGKAPERELPFSYPFVLKFDWGGEGESVFLIKNLPELKSVLKKAGEFEKTGQKGFLLQEYIPTGNRSLRVAVIGRKLISYWRVQKDPEIFYSGLTQGAEADYDSDRDLIKIAEDKVRAFCGKTGINLAGFDLLFSPERGNEPLFLEINYFFGRKGLGGSENFYKVLNGEIRKWIKNLGLKKKRK